MTRSRVIIENVQPQVESGLYPAKRTVKELVTFKAHIFTDGHDHIRAEVLYRKKQEKKWLKQSLTHKQNDEWETSLFIPEKGLYEFQIHAWIDHFETWYDGFIKKANAKVDVSVELLEGAIFLKKLSTDKKIVKLANQLEDKTKFAENVAWIQSKEFEEIVVNHPDKQFQTESNIYSLQIEEHRANFTTWYELFPRSASLNGKHGTLRDVEKLLPRIASMGFDVLYMPPVHPIGKINRKGKNNNVRSVSGEPGSPWAIGSDEGGHKAIHPDLGTLDDYKNLIKKANEHGIDIALDLAFQCAPDHPYVKEHPEWFKQRPDGSIQYAENPPKKYQDIYPFDYECESWQELWEELKSVVFFWIDCGVKVFRVDNPHTKPIPFWQWVIAETNKKYEDVIFLSEAFTRPKIMASLAKVGFTQGYTYFTWRVTKAELMQYMNELVHTSSRDYFRPNFWPTTPDILPYHLHYQGENMFIIRLALAATLSSNYGIYGPAYELLDNTPWNGKEEFNDSEKYEVKHYDWKKTNRITDIMTILNKTRKSNLALQSTWNIEFLNIENPNLLAFYKKSDDNSNRVLVVINLDQHNKQAGYLQLSSDLKNTQKGINVKLKDVMTGENYTWTQEWNYVELDPNRMPFHLFEVSIHESNL
ncbi:MAG: alpha-1,4-glucan--maltose-1-phosphate maltosyltransferase [Cyclobacteriaceae bacterium]|nr:alpha-1,4-glucan--maltose-1-phosphate maltosyltransferase [Cyclobacteriaceae bacterium]